MTRCFFSTDFFNSPATREKLSGCIAVEPDLCGDVAECLPIADVTALREVGMKQPFGKIVWFLVLLGEPHQSMGLEGIRGPRNSIEGKHDPVCHTGLGEALFDLPSALSAAELRLKICAAIDTGLRHRRIQMKRPPGHLYVVRIPGGLDPFFPSTLPDEAPGADHIGVDLHVHPGFLHVLPLFQSKCPILPA